MVQSFSQGQGAGLRRGAQTVARADHTGAEACGGLQGAGPWALAGAFCTERARPTAKGLWWFHFDPVALGEWWPLSHTGSFSSQLALPASEGVKRLRGKLPDGCDSRGTAAPGQCELLVEDSMF